LKKASLTQTRDELRELISKSTQVNGWYAHGYEDGTVRGPYHRWFKCSEVDDKYKHNVAPVNDDVNFAAAAMNNLEALLDLLDAAEEKVADLQIELILMGRDPDAIK
jgi:hypothetical protein